MPSSPVAERWAARAQVWLGTLVEIALPSAEATEARFAAAFSAIAHIHHKMSAHDPKSDLARIARDAHRRALVVDPETYAVLELAQALAGESCGLFDVSVAPVLARRRLLPARAAPHATRCGCMAALRLEPGFRVRADAPVALDLGGIAKGHAVDRAVAVLRGFGASTGHVNAGGDLRVFGSGAWLPVRVRHPLHPSVALTLFDVQEAAVATSADYFRGTASALVDPRAHDTRPFGGSATVIAPTCILADALTKVVALEPAQAAAILARHGAHAFHLEAGDDGLRGSTTCTGSTAHLRLPPALAA